jgi:hypothetical protein
MAAAARPRVAAALMAAAAAAYAPNPAFALAPTPTAGPAPWAVPTGWIWRPPCLDAAALCHAWSEAAACEPAPELGREGAAAGRGT